MKVKHLLALILSVAVLALPVFSPLTCYGVHPSILKDLNQRGYSEEDKQKWADSFSGVDPMDIKRPPDIAAVVVPEFRKLLEGEKEDRFITIKGADGQAITVNAGEAARCLRFIRWERSVYNKMRKNWEEEARQDARKRGLGELTDADLGNRWLSHMGMTPEESLETLYRITTLNCTATTSLYWMFASRVDPNRDLANKKDGILFGDFWIREKGVAKLESSKSGGNENSQSETNGNSKSKANKGSVSGLNPGAYAKIILAQHFPDLPEYGDPPLNDEGERRQAVFEAAGMFRVVFSQANAGFDKSRSGSNSGGNAPPNSNQDGAEQVSSGTEESPSPKNNADGELVWRGKIFIDERRKNKAGDIIVIPVHVDTPEIDNPVNPEDIRKGQDHIWANWVVVERRGMSDPRQVCIRYAPISISPTHLPPKPSGATEPREAYKAVHTPNTAMHDFAHAVSPSNLAPDES